MRRLLMAAAGLLAVAGPAAAFEPREVFTRNGLVLSGEVGYGEQNGLGRLKEVTGQDVTGLKFVNAGFRAGWLPFGVTNVGPLTGALEAGLEPFVQVYTEPVNDFFGGLNVVLRYHFLSLGRLVPYVEISGGAGGTTLEVREIDSAFTFLLFGGVGASYFVTDRTAVYAGYRFEHVSNARTNHPNFGINANGAVVGVSFFFR